MRSCASGKMPTSGGAVEQWLPQQRWPPQLAGPRERSSILPSQAAARPARRASVGIRKSIICAWLHQQARRISPPSRAALRQRQECSVVSPRGCAPAACVSGHYSRARLYFGGVLQTSQQLAAGGAQQPQIAGRLDSLLVQHCYLSQLCSFPRARVRALPRVSARRTASDGGARTHTLAVCCSVYHSSGAHDG